MNHCRLPLCLLLAAFAGPMFAEETKDPDESRVRFDPVKKNIEGWTVHIDPAMLKGEHAEAGGKALGMLANHLQRIAIFMPEKFVGEFTIPLYVPLTPDVTLTNGQPLNLDLPPIGKFGQQVT